MKIAISFPPLEGPGCPTLGQNRQFQWFNNPSFIYPMVPASAATLLRHEGHEVIWDDALAKRWTYEQWLDFINKEKPDLIAIETKTPVVKQHWRIIADLKSAVRSPQSAENDLSTPDSGLRTQDNQTANFERPIVVLIGDHATAMPDESMRSSKVDFVLTGGDYDVQLLQLCRAIELAVDSRQSAVNDVPAMDSGLRTMDSGLPPGVWYRNGSEIRNTGPFQLDHDLNLLPFIDREFTEWHRYGEKLYKREPFTYTMVGRDCWWAKCTFCSWTTTYPTFRTRTPASLLDEIGTLIEEQGVKEIFDDTGTFPSGNWLKEFCDGMIRRGYNRRVRLSCNFRFNSLNDERASRMRKAGFRLLKLGLESANDKTLEHLQKGCTVNEIISGANAAKRAGLDVHLTTMVGYPWETKEETYRTLNLARQMMVTGLADMLQATVVTPYPGTPLYEEAVANDWLLVDPKDYDSFDMTKPILRMPDMTSEEVVEACQSIYRSFLEPRYLLRNLMSVRSVADARFLVRGVKPVLGHLKDFSLGRQKNKHSDGEN